MGLGIVLVLVAFALLSYTRAGVYTRTYTRASAATSSTLNFQARLLNASGSIVADGNYSVEFNLYDVSIGGSTQWTETQVVPVKSGYLSVYLGNVTPLPTTIDWSQEQWLTMNVNGDGEMSPRLKLTAVPYAFQAGELAKTVAGNKGILSWLTPTANRTINLPDASGTVALSSGGTFTNNGVLYGDGTSVIQNTAAGTTGQCLVATTGNAPSWGTCGSSTLQQAYASSTNPQITLNSTQGNITIQDNATPIGGNLFEVTNNGGATKFLAVTSAGVSTSGTLTSGGALTVTSGGASITGGIDNNSGGITETGNITGVGANITASGALTVSSGATGVLSLVSQDQSAGSTNSAGIIIQSGNASGATSNSGSITLDSGTATGTAGAISIGVTNASGVNIGRSGTITRIDGNLGVGTGTTPETLTVNGAINIGTTGSSNAGTIRWTGSDFEGYNGVTWLSLTDDYTGTPTINITKTVQEQVNNNTFQPDDELTFAINANETWTFRFYVQATSPTAADIKFSVSAPTGATCSYGAGDYDNASSISDLACDASTGIIATSNGPEIYEVTGTVFNGANAGNVTLNWAQNATSGTTTVHDGSYVLAMRTSGSLSDNNFTNGGNSFGGQAEVGTNDNYGLDILTNGSARISIANSGAIALSSATTASAGLIISSGNLDLSGTESIVGVGSNITGSGALTLASGGGADLTLDSASNVLALSDSVLRRLAAGTTSLELNDASDTAFSIINSDGGAVANLNVEGAINSGAITATSFSGDGSGLTSLNAGSITSGTISNSRLDSTVALLNSAQTFTAVPTFDEGVVLGNSTSTTSGALRWSGTDFEGYDGIQWVSLTGGGSGSGPLTVAFIQAYDNTGGTDLNTGTPTAVPWDSETHEDVGFTHDNVTNNTRVYLDDPGWYKISYNVSGINQSANRNTVFCQMRLNGSTYNAPSGSYSYTRDTTNAEATNTATVYIETTASNEYYEVLCSQAGTAGAQLAEAGRSWTIADKVVPIVSGAGLTFEQDGNAFGETAILGTTDSFGLNFITNNSTALSIDSLGNSTFAGTVNLNGGAGFGTSADFNSNDITELGNIYGAAALELSSGGTGALSLKSANQSTASTNSAGVSLLSGNASGSTSNSGDLTIDAGTATGTAGIIYLGTANASAVNVGRSGTLTTIGGALAVSGNDISIGTNSLAGTITLYDGSSNTGAFQTTSLASNRTYTLPDSDGTICLDSNNCSLVQLAAGSEQVDASTNASVNINKTGASGDILTLEKNGNGVFTVFNSGATQISTDDTAALQVRNAGGTLSYLTVDTSGSVVQVGSSTADATGILFILDSKSTAGDPTGVAGAQYYNDSSDKFRCFQNGSWMDCLPSSNTQYSLSAENITWSNMPAADTEFGSTTYRTRVDLTNSNEFRLVIRYSGGTVTAGADCRLQYATTEAGAWTNLDGGAGPELDISGAVGTKTSAWASVDGGAKADVYIRMMCKQGNGANDPQFRGVHFQIR